MEEWGEHVLNAARISPQEDRADAPRVLPVFVFDAAAKGARTRRAPLPHAARRGALPRAPPQPLPPLHQPWRA